MRIDGELRLIQEEGGLSEAFQRLRAGTCLCGALERRARLDPTALAQRGLPGPKLILYVRRRHGNLIISRAGAGFRRAEKGYAAVTVSDIVERANVSRRTFYEHFKDKEDCFIAAYDAGSEELFGRVVGAQSHHQSWPERARAAVHAYLHAFAEEPAYAKATMVEVLSAGPKALAHRRRAHHRYARLLRDLHLQACEERPELRELPNPLFTPPSQPPTAWSPTTSSEVAPTNSLNWRT